MSLELTTISLKLPDTTIKQLRDLEEAFNPLFENRSQLIRFTVAFVHDAVFMVGNVTKALERLQGLLSSTSERQGLVPKKREAA